MYPKYVLPIQPNDLIYWFSVNLFTVTKEETESLINMFRSLGKVNPARPDKLERTQVREQLHVKFGVTDDLILDRSKSTWICYIFIFKLKDSGTFSKCPQIYVKLTGFEDNDSGKLPFKYY